MIAHNPNEIIAVVNDDDELVSQASRRTVHKKGLLHREVYVYLMFREKVWLQVREDIKLFDHSCAGHFPVKQSYEEAAVRELREELGIKAAEKELLFVAKKRFETCGPDYVNKRFAKVFIIKRKPEFHLDTKEVKSVCVCDAEMLSLLLKAPEKLTPSAKEIIIKHILPLLKKSEIS